MLMFIFGAGASFDSDPYRRPEDPDLLNYDTEHRPPLAAGLFDPASDRGKEVVAAFPRAASLIMQLRQATSQGLDVEEVLEQIKAAEGSYPETAAQLLAFRAYLARLMSEVPDRWVEECQGLTNYVRVLDKADRWNVSVHPNDREPVVCVTFNYDTLLERAVNSVFGYAVTDMDRYTGNASVHVFKPHGSVTWRIDAQWDVPPGEWLEDDDALSIAVNDAARLTWGDRWAYVTDEMYQDANDATTIWLPALSIPVRSKSEFTMPAWHMDSMIEDLGHVTTLVAVGWRARERHFLRLLQDRMPSTEARLVAVAESDDAAQETIDNLWETGRFGSYAKSGIGFSGFAESPTAPFAPAGLSVNQTQLTFDHVLSAGPGSGVWTNRRPGPGLADLPDETPFEEPGYAEL